MTIKEVRGSDKKCQREGVSRGRRQQDGVELEAMCVLMLCSFLK